VCTTLALGAEVASAIESIAPKTIDQFEQASSATAGLRQLAIQASFSCS
jgi:hypothetical protein